METDTPHDQEDPHSQADEGHLQDGAGAVQDDRPAHVALAPPFQAGARHPRNRKDDDPNKRENFQRSDVTLIEKQRLLKEFDKLPKMSKYKAAETLGFKRPFLNNLLGTHDKIMSPVPKHLKHIRNGTNVQVEDVTVRWLRQKRDQRGEGKEEHVSSPSRRQFPLSLSPLRFLRSPLS